MEHNIVVTISEHLNLTKRKKNYFGLCPFHYDKTPSFTVYPDRDMFHCFGCGAEGDSNDFIEKLCSLAWIRLRNKYKA